MHSPACKYLQVNNQYRQGMFESNQTIFWNWATIFGSQLLLLLFFLVQHDLLSHAALILVQASTGGKHHCITSSRPCPSTKVLAVSFTAIVSVGTSLPWNSSPSASYKYHRPHSQAPQVSSNQWTKCRSLMHSAGFTRSTLWIFVIISHEWWPSGLRSWWHFGHRQCNPNWAATRKAWPRDMWGIAWMCWACWQH